MSLARAGAGEYAPRRMADPEKPRETSAESPPPEEAARPAPRKKKAAKSKGEAKAAEAPKPIPGAGTPEGRKLREALRAAEVGDHVRLRRLTRELEEAPDPAVREAAAELAERVAIDPVQVVVFLACAAVLATIAYVWVV